MYPQEEVLRFIRICLPGWIPMAIGDLTCFVLRKRWKKHPDREEPIKDWDESIILERATSTNTFQLSCDREWRVMFVEPPLQQSVSILADKTNGLCLKRMEEGYQNNRVSLLKTPFFFCSIWDMISTLFILSHILW